MLLTIGDHILFFGDSITDCGRDRTDSSSLGDGYANLIASQLSLAHPEAGFRFTNKGISGNRVYDLETRLETDVLAEKPTVVSILIGINDTWRNFDRDISSPIPEFQASYRRILERLCNSGVRSVILLEQFLLPIPEDRKTWRRDVDERIIATRELAWEFHLPYLPLDGLFAAEAARQSLAGLLPDGVHPSPEGHALIAAEWLRIAGAPDPA